MKATNRSELDEDLCMAYHAERCCRFQRDTDMAPVEYKCPLLMYMYIINPADELLNEYDLCYLSSKYRERLTTFSRVQIALLHCF